MNTGTDQSNRRWRAPGLVVIVAIFAAVLGVVPTLASPSNAAAQDGDQVVESIVALGSTWSYLDDGSDQGNAWVDPAFDDSAWATGPGEFGYGGGDEVTVVGFGGDPNNRHATTYFRHGFNVDAPHQLFEVRAKIKRDDAAIVYLNGAEVWRSSNLPANVAFDTFATSNASEGVFDEVIVPLDQIQDGANTFAVEIHNRGVSNSDVSFAFSLEADRDPLLPPGPRMAGEEFEVAAGEPLSGSIADNDIAGLTYSVDPAALPDPATQGTLTIDAAGLFTWTPAAQFAGTVVVAVQGCGPDDPAYCGSRELGIDVLGVSADDDRAETPFGTPVSGNVAANDSDRGNGALTWSVLTLPDAGSEGVLDFAPDGAWTFTPAAGFEGGVDVDYQACDAQGDCDSATLTILVATNKLELEFSQSRGFITGPITVELSTPDPDATIRYSTAWGVEWIADEFIAVSQAYTGPINVSGSTQIRAIAITDDQRTEVQSHTFIDISNYSANNQAKIRQYPVLEIPNLPNGNRYSDQRSLIEVFWPDDRHPGVSAPAGVRNRQGGTGQWGDFRLYFRSEYGDGRLDYDFFPDVNIGSQTSGKADKINFHGGSQDGFATFGQGCTAPGGTMMKDRFYQHLQTEMNGDGVNGQYYLMFSKGKLVGVKNAEDVPHQGWHEDTFGGGEKSDFVLETIYSKDGPFTDWNAAQGSDFSRFAQSVDVTNYIDYHLVQWYSGNRDWPNNNMLLGGLAAGGPFYNWAFDMHYTGPGCPRVNTYFGSPPRSDPDFLMEFADRTYLHYQPGGPLSPEGLLSRWDALAAQLQPAVSLVYSENSWRDNEQRVRNTHTNGSSTLLNALRSAGYASTVAPVSYSIDGGVVPSGTSVSLSGGAQIYYTIDGTDPRASGGGVSGSAISYGAPVALPDGTVQMLARVRSGNDWSAAQPVMFQVGDGPGLVINEIHFNPADGEAGGVEVDGDEYEFIELANLGSTGVDLEYFRLQGGLRMKFDYNRSPIIAPGEFVVLAENAQRFEERYGFAPDGEYLGKLSNGSDEIRLVDTHLNDVDVVTYQDDWAQRSDGEGPTLSFAGFGDNAVAEGWGRSAVDGGTPGAANVLAQPEAAAEPGLILNEWNSVSASNLLTDGDVRLGSVRGNGGDWFELVVVNDHVDARGWRVVVSDTGGSEVLILSQDPVWSDLRSGTVITIAENDVVAEDGTVYAEDTGYDPQGGDWWIHAVAGEGGNGGLITAVNFPVTANDWQAAIYNAAGEIQWGPLGEGIGALLSGVGNDEIGELEADPSPDIDPSTAPYDDGDESTFGLPNNFGEGAQNFGLLRSVVNAPPVVAPIADQTGGVGNSVSITATAVDNEGDSFTWSADGLPPGITIDANTGVISGTYTEAGVFNVTVSATDVFSPGTATFVWDIAANGLPAIAAVDDQASITGDAISLQLTANDPEGDVFTWSATGLPSGLAIDAATGLISGTVDTMTTYQVEVQATDAFGVGVLALNWTVTDPEAKTTVTCEADDTGTVTVDLFNSTGGFATYRITIGNGQTEQRSISDGLRTTVTASGLLDGNITVTVKRGGADIYTETVAVTCGGVAPTPTATPTPDPTPTPDGAINGASSPVEIMQTVTCLASNGRVDTNIVNTGTATANYRIEFEGLSARARNVDTGDWWRMPITGRPDRDFNVIVKRDNVVVSDTTITVSCDSDPVVNQSPEVQVVNACRNGNGYILFQFANPTNANKAWVIEFEGVTNRSTSAGPHAGAVRAVTGRQNGTYNVLIRTGSTPVALLQVTVNCD